MRPLCVSVPDSLQNWEAVDGGARDGRRIYINVCHKVLQQGATEGCPDEAAICAVGESEGPSDPASFSLNPCRANVMSD